MILLAALPAGLLTGLLAARWRRSRWEVPALRFAWLAVVAFVPQYLAIYFLPTRGLLSDEWAAAGLLLSQALFLVFCWLNRRVPGIAVLAVGLVANLLVMALNGGFMPISPETASRLVPPGMLDDWASSRFGWKDILLPLEDTRLALLSDRLLPPVWFPYQVAFSLGDVFVAAGAFWLMAAGGFNFNKASKGR
ncbi:MAG: hypothetical protein FD146_109 [Anaerolineaceae bacterium]|nr:MAG: hypothetical protein FD146_109 [Anaerolineaceae bacterium]